MSDSDFNDREMVKAAEGLSRNPHRSQEKVLVKADCVANDGRTSVEEFSDKSDAAE